MANQNVGQILSDPNFRSLSINEQRKVILKVDPNFGNLNAQEQNKVLRFSGQERTPEIRQDRPIRQAISGVARTGLETVGLIGGGILGTPEAPGVGTVIGAGLGYSAGGQAADYLDMLMGLREDPGLSAQGKQAIDDFVTGVQLEAGGQVGGRVATKVLEKVAAPFAKTITPEAVAAEKELQRVTGVGFTPAQKSEDKAVDLLEEIAEKSFTSARGFRTFRLKQEKGLQDYISNVTDDIASGLHGKLTAEETGDLVFQTLQGRNVAFRNQAEKLYSQVDEIAQAATVDLRPLKNMAYDALAVAEKRKGIGATQAGDALLKRVTQLDDFMAFKDAQSLRSGFIDEVASMSVSKDKATGLAKRFLKTTDEAMEFGAGRLRPEAKDAWRQANAFYRQGKERFDNQFLRKLSKTLQDRPEVIIDKVFTKNAVGPIKKLKASVDVETWQTIKSAHLEKMLTEATSPDGAVLGKSLFGKLRNIGDDALREVYSPAELKRIRNIQQIAQVLQKPIGGGGGIFIKFAQFAAAGGFLYGQVEGIPVLVGPYALSKIMIHPKWSKWLAEGLTVKPGTKQATEVGIKLLGVLSMLERERAAQETEPTPDPGLGAL